MRTDPWERVKHVYVKLLDLPPDERHAYLEETCRDESFVRAEVESLLGFERASEFMETPALEMMARSIGADEERADLVGMTVARYRVLERIGAGGMGVVYRARDDHLQRDVAIKVLNTIKFVFDRRMPALQEARAAAALNHPGICTVYDVSAYRGRAYIVMELVVGQTLDHRLRSGAMPIEDCIRCGIQLSAALAHAHSHGVVHGDFKSANVMVTDEGVKVLDFGLATRATSEHWPDVAENRPGAYSPVGGTVAYMAPEQLRGEPGDARSDLWSLGIVLYEMTVGSRPFQARTWSALRSAILNESPQPVPAHVPVRVRSIIDRCLAKNPEARYQECIDVQRELQALTAVEMRNSPIHFRTGSKRIAVLPFENLSPDPRNTYITSAVHESLISDLHRFSGLSLIGRRSLAAYECSRKPLHTISAELGGVDAVITGATEFSASGIQVSLQLLDPTTGEVWWAERYKEHLTAVPDLLRDIVGAVVEVMNIKRSGTEQESPTMRSIDAGAYELYAKGRYSLNTLTADGLAEGLDHLKAAVDRDPNQPLLLAGVALAYILIAHQASIVLVADPFQLAKPYVNRAMELDPMLPEAHQALAEINAYRDWDFSGAEAEYRRALHLSNGNLPDAHANYSWYLMLYGRTGEQLAEMKAALDLEPLNPVYHVWMGQQYAADGRWDDAMTECRRALDLNSAIPDGLVLLGNLHAQKGMLDEAVAYHQKAASIDTGLSTYALACTYARLGRHEEARRIRDQLRNRPRHWDTLGLAAIHAALDEKDEAMRWLEAMYQQRHMFTPWLKVGPEFVGLHADPRFQSLMARVGVER